MSEWSVELKIYEFHENPHWYVNLKILKKIFKILAKKENSHGVYSKEINLPKVGIYLLYNQEIVLVSVSRLSIYKRLNVYEFIKDENRQIERLLVSCAPSNYKDEIQYYQKLSLRNLNFKSFNHGIN